jgi:hypothetical protein
MLLVFFSLQGFSQSTNTFPEDKSDHPLLDKYYPQPKEKAPGKVTPPPAVPSAVNPLPTTQAPAKPVVIAAPAPVANPEVETAPASKAEALPVQGSAPTMSSATIPVTANTPAATPKAVAPVADKVPTPPFNPNRLGSSTKKYDTWEKNNNGAGSVTTSPKG